MELALLDILRCPSCRTRLSAFDESGGACTAGPSSDGARIVRCDACARWYPVIDGIPRVLPDALRDTAQDDEFFAANQPLFSRLGVSRSHFGTKAAGVNLYRQFQKQRVLWGKQDRWEDLYLAPVQYSKPDWKRKRRPSSRWWGFFSMNIHCDYGDQPRKDEIVRAAAAGGGKVTLDIGCGAAANRAVLQEKGNRYVGLDLVAYSGPDIQATAAQLPFEDGAFDFIVCDSVLEHVYDPWTVCGEIFRVLKPGGEALFIVPFTYKSHAAPFDFYRYTKSGLHTLLRNYRTVTMYSFGGFFHVVGHMAEAFYPHIPLGLGRVMKALHNCVFFVLNKLDRFDRHRIFCRGYYAVVEK